MSEELAFTGTLVMQASISETVTGLKSVLLKAIDPLFRHKGGGSEIPIRIGGTIGSPSFGLDTSASSRALVERLQVRGIGRGDEMDDNQARLTHLGHESGHRGLAIRTICHSRQARGWRHGGRVPRR